MYIANCPFNKMKILSDATIGLEKSFPMMYSNIGLNSRETVPLNECHEAVEDYFGAKNKMKEKEEKLYKRKGSNTEGVGVGGIQS